MTPSFRIASLSRLAASWACVGVILSGIELLPLALAQTKSALEGVVVTADGKPVAGVTVYGSVWKRCCPYQRDEVKTDDKGKFHLEHPGAVLHFSKSDMQPLAFVVRPGTAQVRIIMTVDKNSLTVPVCAPADHHQKQIGWGKYGLHFTVPKTDVKILGGEPDVDYVRYVIKPNRGEAYLSLWFGPYSISSEPDDQQFVDSVSFSQRNLTSAKGEVIGIDAWGQSNGGLNWRHTAVAASGAIYENADKESAALFDQIINSICTVAYPPK